MPIGVFPKSQLIDSRAQLEARSSDPVFSVFISATPIPLSKNVWATKGTGLPTPMPIADGVQ